MLEYLLRISFDVLTIERLEMEIVAAVTLAGFSQGSDLMICEYNIVFIEALSLSLSLSILYKGIGFSLTIEEGGGRDPNLLKIYLRNMNASAWYPRSIVSSFRFLVPIEFLVPSFYIL